VIVVSSARQMALSASPAFPINILFFLARFPASCARRRALGDAMDAPTDPPLNYVQD
jgi:hypothetical protein